MKLKNQFLRLFALLGLSMAATTAWAAEVELQGNATDGYYVKMPTPVKNTRVNAELSITNNDVKSFKVYDDGGATASYTATSCSASSTSCAVNLLLTAPEDYLLSVAGSLSYVSGGKPYLRIYDGADTEASHNVINIQGLQGQVLSVGRHLTSGRSMLIQFYTAVNNSGTNEGNLELIIDLVPVNLVIEQSGTSTFEPVKDAFEIQVPASVGDIDNTTTLTAPEGYVLYVANTTTPNGGSMTVDGNLSSSLTVHVTTESSGFASALNVPVHVLKKTTSTTAIDIYTQDDNSYAVAKITDGNYENSGAVSIPSAINVDVIEYDREFAANTMETIVLPFSLPSGATTNAKFYYLQKVVQPTGVCAWKATLKRVATPEANKPYAIKILDGGTELQIDLGGNKATFQTSETVEQTDATGKWIFKGTYQYKVWNASDTELGLAYALAKENGTNYSAGQFVKIGEGSTAAPMRAYMRKISADVKLSPIGAGRPLAMGEVSSIENMPEVIDAEFIDEDEQTTAIGRMNTVTGAIKIDRWFDLKGRSTNHKPTTKGAFFNKKGIAK